MSLLVSTASPWTNDEPPKKRIPSMRRTVRKSPALDASSANNNIFGVGAHSVESFATGGDDLDTLGDYQGSKYVSQQQMYQDDKNQMHQQVNDQEKRQSRVNELINQMQSLKADNDGKNLADFKPLSHPIVNTKKDASVNDLFPPMAGAAFKDSFDTGGMAASPYPVSTHRDSMRPTIASNNPDLDKIASYQMAYQVPTKITNAPYYSGGAGLRSQGGTLSNDNTLLDKINYMIHLLEEQSNEKTHNSMEEFAMFTLVGVFIIYVLDSFSRSGRYTR